MAQTVFIFLHFFDSFFCVLILLETLALYKSFTYLLTYLLIEFNIHMF